MRPHLLKVSSGPEHSFSVRQDRIPDTNSKWHCHPELELLYFEKGNGTQFVGDNIQKFESGDLVLIGSNLPHYWRFDSRYFKENQESSVDVKVVHFCENFWGDSFLQLPENKLI